MNKIIIVTGASGDIGKTLADYLHTMGNTVIGLDLNPPKETFYFTFKFCDITDKDKTKIIIENIIREFGTIDVLINNAGVTYPNTSSEYPEELWDKTYEVNLKAPYRLITLVAQTMISKKQGIIINIASLNSEFAFPDNPAYNACKGGLKQLTMAFARDLGKYGIRVNAISPGYIRTSMTKNSWHNLEKREVISNKTMLGRWGTPEDIIGIIEFLISDKSSYITGQNIMVDGGWSSKGL